MATTSIEWTRGDDGTPGAVWNPTTGCDKVSDGCTNCYALTMAKRLKGMGQAKYQNDGDPRTSGPGFGLTVHPDALSIPLGWVKPRRIFVNSMSDLFHARVPREFVARVFAVMAATPQHTYQVLTKRTSRMAALLSKSDFYAEVRQALRDHHGMSEVDAFGTDRFPLWNGWLGTSVEDQKQALLRVPALKVTPAAVRWLSLEPLLGPVDLGDCAGIDWAVIGGESGAGARPMDEAWVRSLIEQCRAVGVPVFVKQMGEAWAKQHGGSKKGGSPQYWPEDLRVREYPVVRAAAEVPR